MGRVAAITELPVAQRTDLIEGSSVLLVTRHGKAKAIAPPMRDAFGVRLGLAVGVDTDNVRQNQSSCNALDAALAKIQAGFETVPYARFAVAGAGEFRTDPETPGVLAGSEFVVLAERSAGTVAIGRCDVERPVDIVRVETMESAMDFATAVGFPRRAVRLLRPSGEVLRQIETLGEFEDTVQSLLTTDGPVTFESDRRAHRCTWRMAAVERATMDLVHALQGSSRLTTPAFAEGRSQA